MYTFYSSSSTPLFLLPVFILLYLLVLLPVLFIFLKQFSFFFSSSSVSSSSPSVPFFILLFHLVLLLLRLCFPSLSSSTSSPRPRSPNYFSSPFPCSLFFSSSYPSPPLDLHVNTNSKNNPQANLDADLQFVQRLWNSDNWRSRIKPCTL